MHYYNNYIEASEVDAPPPTNPAASGDILTTPAVRRIANELNVDLNDVMMTSSIL